MPMQAFAASIPAQEFVVPDIFEILVSELLCLGHRSLVLSIHNHSRLF